MHTMSDLMICSQDLKLLVLLGPGFVGLNGERCMKYDIKQYTNHILFRNLRFSFSSLFQPERHRSKKKDEGGDGKKSWPHKIKCSPEGFVFGIKGYSPFIYHL